MGKRRHFLFSFAGIAALLLIICGFWPRSVAIEESEAQALLKVWLAADYRQSSDDPALRGPSSSTTPLASASETGLIIFTHFEARRPFIRPSDAEHAALVRVEIAYAGSVPTEGENIRYFLLAQKENEAWQVRREIGESAYRWRLSW
jgi:hypothetical protein